MPPGADFETIPALPSHFAIVLITFVIPDHCKIKDAPESQENVTELEVYLGKTRGGLIQKHIYYRQTILLLVSY